MFLKTTILVLGKSYRIFVLKSREFFLKIPLLIKDADGIFHTVTLHYGPNVFIVLSSDFDSCP